MPIVCDWELQEFSYGNINSQRIDFRIDDHLFSIFFTPVDSFGDEVLLAEKSQIVGFEIPENSYDVKFDRVENYQTGNFYEKPAAEYSYFDYEKIRRLGAGLCKLLEFHYSISRTEAYFGTAADSQLKRYYDRLVKLYAHQLHFDVISNLGEEGLDYAIKTPRYQSQS